MRVRVLPGLGAAWKRSLHRSFAFVPSARTEPAFAARWIQTHSKHGPSRSCSPRLTCLRVCCPPASRSGAPPKKIRPFSARELRPQRCERILFRGLRVQFSDMTFLRQIRLALFCDCLSLINVSVSLFGARSVGFHCKPTAAARRPAGRRTGGGRAPPAWIQKKRQQKPLARQRSS